MFPSEAPDLWLPPQESLPLDVWEIPSGDHRFGDLFSSAPVHPALQAIIDWESVKEETCPILNQGNFRHHQQPERPNQIPACSEISIKNFKTTALFDKNPDGSSRTDSYVISQWIESIPKNCIPVIVTRFTNPADGSTHAVISFVLNSDYQKRLGAKGFATSQAYEYHLKAPWLINSHKYPDNLDPEIRSAGFEQIQPFPVEEIINGQLRRFTLRADINQIHVKLASSSANETQIDWGVNISPDRKPSLSDLIIHMITNFRADLNDDKVSQIQFPILDQITTPLPNREELAPALDKLVPTPTPLPTYTPTPQATFTPRPEITNTPIPPDQVFALNEGISAAYESPASKVYLNLTIHGSDQLNVYDITDDDLTKDLEEKLSNPTKYQKEIPSIANKIAGNANNRGLINTANFIFHLGHKEEYDQIEAKRLTWKDTDTKLLLIHQIQKDNGNILVTLDENTGRKYLIYLDKQNTDMMAYAAYDDQLNFLPNLSANLNEDMLNTVGKIRVGNRPEMMDIRDSAFIVPPGYSHALRGLSFNQASVWLNEYLAPISGTQTIHVQDQNGNSYPLQVNTGLLINNPRLVRSTDGTYRIYGKLSTFGQRTMDQNFFEQINQLFGALNITTLDVVIDPNLIGILDYKPLGIPGPTPTYQVTPTLHSQAYPTSLQHDPTAKLENNQNLLLMRNRLSRKSSLHIHNYRVNHTRV